MIPIFSFPAPYTTRHEKTFATVIQDYVKREGHSSSMPKRYVEAPPHERVAESKADRKRILSLLKKHGPLCHRAIGRHMPFLGSRRLSNHLRVLKTNGLIVRVGGQRKAGKWRVK